MENVSDALKMAGSVLLFIIGLSVAILAFSQAREAIDTVLRYTDREYLTIEGDSRFYYLSNKNDTNRYVGLETIIPSMVRAAKESYKIVFEFDDNYYLYKERVSKEEIKEVDSKQWSKPSEVIAGILYGTSADADFINRFGVELNSTCLYDYILEKQRNNYLIKESLGVYVQEEIKSEGDTSVDTGTSSVPEINQYQQRIITYTFIRQ